MNNFKIIKPKFTNHSMFIRTPSRHLQSGQAILGNLIFLMIVIGTTFYFIFVAKSVHKFYAKTLRSRFEVIREATHYAHLLNEISINNQNILISLITAQKAYITAIETGLIVSYTQPYWDTYKSLKNNNVTHALSADAYSVIEKSFHAYALTTGRAFFTAKSLAFQNGELVKQLPHNIQIFFQQTSNHAAHCLALEFQQKDLSISHYAKFFIPSFYSFGVTKQNCTIQHKTNILHDLLKKGLPILNTNESNFIINFEKIDDYTPFNDIDYGFMVVDINRVNEFLQNTQFELQNPLRSLVRITHPKFSCVSSSYSYDFIEEKDWDKPCVLSETQFLKSFFMPHWSAILTYQEAQLSIK